LMTSMALANRTL